MADEPTFTRPDTVQSLFLLVIRFCVRHVLLFILFAGILIAGHWIVSQRDHLASLIALPRDVATLAAVAQDVTQYQAPLTNALTTRTNAWRGASLAALDARIASLTDMILRQTSQARAPVLSLPLSGGDDLARSLGAHFKRELDLAVLRQERDYLLELRRLAAAAADARLAQAKLAELHVLHTQHHAAYVANNEQMANLRRAHPFAIYLPGTQAYRAFTEAMQARDQARERNALAARAYAEQQRAISLMAPLHDLAAFRPDQKAFDAVLRPLHDTVAAGRTQMASNWLATPYRLVREVAPTALLLVVAAMLTPLAIKSVFYFVLAPLATKLRPIVVDATATGTLADPDVSDQPDATRATSARSAVAQSITLGKDDELLIHSDYLQSSSITGNKDTRWLLDWSCPLTSLAAGLWMLTRIRGGACERVVISSSDNPFSEVALLTLPPGAAMVFQPRSLIGVMYPTHAPLTIRRRWRLGSLHAWLTLQLRYLVFHGPVTLIVHGSRGVRVEPAGNGRRISQSATLGFSAQVAYATIRCETFMPYLTGRQALFHDCFTGPTGCYVYEETPRAGKKPGTLSRGIEGLTDACLKVFGI